MKKTLKKLFVVLLALGFVASFASCKKDAEPETNSGRSDTQQTQPNNGDDNNNGGEQGDNGGQSGDNGGSADAAATWYSYEYTIDGDIPATFTFGADEKCTNADADDATKAAVEIAFISFDVAGDFWTKFIVSGEDMWDEDLADLCTVKTEDGKFIINNYDGTPYVECTINEDGTMTAVIEGDTYKFKKAE